YAVKAAETYGAGSYNVLELRIIGEALPARPFKHALETGQAVRIMTGAPVPAGADAVIPAEAAPEGDGIIAVTESVPPGRNVGAKGEDITPGTVVLRQGRVLRPQDLGVLAS